MSGVEYCAPRDLYSYGLPRGALSNPGRLAAGASTVTSAITLDVHGLSDGDAFTLRAEGVGSLPPPLAEGTTYYAITLSESSFQASATAGGSAITLTGAGTRFVVIVPLDVHAAILWASRVIDDKLAAHVVSLDANDVPEIVKITAAELAAAKLLSLAPNTSSRPLAEVFDAANTRLEKWARGQQVRPGNAQPANLAVGVARACASSDWKRYGGL